MDKKPYESPFFDVVELSTRNCVVTSIGDNDENTSDWDW